MTKQMKGININEKHISITSSNNVIEICKPLFKQFGLTFFFYARLFYDNTLYVLTTDILWHKHAFENRFIVIPLKLPPNLKYASFFCLWSDLLPELILSEAKKFKINQPISYIELTRNYFDLYAFATNVNTNLIISNYLNNVNILKKFAVYFKEEARKLIKLCDKDRIFIPKHIQFPADQKILEN